MIREDYNRDGYVIVPELLTTTEVDELVAETLTISRGERGAIPGAPTAAEIENDDDSAILNRFIAIHFPHKISTVMLAALKHPGVVDVLIKLLGPNIKAMPCTSNPFLSTDFISAVKPTTPTTLGHSTPETTHSGHG